ncbi:unnamed protein product (macronuclear) [Paramecium tetraurelia]|uniref:Uncharacterized protein n=1 Tax=Paramecium tetraurelia TaxID=5888 RepID=A0DNC2_PARTE|nr:uncharacterized protein GSPATT00018734001 [Paramecium tetraurelia]CAK84539.1 unnamed protein product [Paramecium tetraurelia]|eukprot:XP_001451936.1 hypothetical protein (macronuclear) [Paramecium tetraurelia strain d4-2]
MNMGCLFNERNIFISSCLHSFDQTETEHNQLIHKINFTIWEIINKLSDMEDRYQKEQMEDAEEKVFQDACNDDISVYDNDIANTDSERVSLEARLEAYSLWISHREIDELDAERVAQHIDLEEFAADHNTVIAVLTESRNIIKANVEATSSLVEKQAIHQKKKSHRRIFHFFRIILRNHKEIIKFQRFVLVMKLLSQIASKTKFYDTTIQKQQLPKILHIMVDLFDRLISEDSDSLSSQRFAEDKRVEVYNKQENVWLILSQQLNLNQQY